MATRLRFRRGGNEVVDPSHRSAIVRPPLPSFVVPLALHCFSSRRTARAPVLDRNKIPAFRADASACLRAFFDLLQRKPTRHSTERFFALVSQKTRSGNRPRLALSFALRPVPPSGSVCDLVR